MSTVALVPHHEVSPVPPPARTGKACDPHPAFEGARGSRPAAEEGYVARLLAEDARRHAELRDAFRWSAVGDLLLAQREFGHRRRFATEALLRRAEYAVLEAWDATQELAGDLAARDRSAFPGIASIIGAARARLLGPGGPDRDRFEALVARALALLWSLDEAAPSEMP